MNSADTPRLPWTFTAPIHTDRLVLRLMTRDDVPDVYAYQSREDVCRYLLFEPRTLEQVTAKVTEFSAATTLAVDGDFLQLALELPATADAPARVIGDSYFTIANAENSRGEIGWTMHPDFVGKGYASEAARAVLRIAFVELGLHRVIAELDPRNDASIALCKRLGMREEAYLVKDLWYKDEWSDTGMYAILRDEYLAQG
jgi:RimJ/RimL family protein N-acetyltransferase